MTTFPPAVVRPYQSSDRTSVVALWSSSELTRPWNDPDEDLERKLANDADGLLVLELDGRVVGSVMVGYDGHRGWLHYLAVDPEHRGQGLGSRLVADAERRLAAFGCPKVNLQIRATNAGVIAFYERLGYCIDEVVSMGKRLGSST